MKKFVQNINLISLAVLILIAVCAMLGIALVPESAMAIPLIGLATLAANKPRAKDQGDINEVPVIAADIIYEGAAVGRVKASGHARPLTSADKFIGFAEAKADNSAGAAAAINARVYKRGAVQLAVTGAVITDIDQPVYATDDDTFTLLPTGGVFVGFLRRFVSSAVAVVEYDIDKFADPYGGGVYETISGAKTLDLEDSGKTFFVTATAIVTLPATAVDMGCTLVCAAPYGTAQISLDPAAADKIVGPDFTGADNTDYLNTLATAQRGDLCTIKGGHIDGYIIVNKKGVWASA